LRKTGVLGCARAEVPSYQLLLLGSASHDNNQCILLDRILYLAAY
jgi:hypothetical protein